MASISKDGIVKFFEENTNDLKKIFIGVSPSNYVVKFINFHRMAIKEKKIPSS